MSSHLPKKWLFENNLDLWIWRWASISSIISWIFIKLLSIAIVDIEKVFTISFRGLLVWCLGRCRIYQSFLSKGSRRKLIFCFELTQSTCLTHFSFNCSFSLKKFFFFFQLPWNKKFFEFLAFQKILYNFPTQQIWILFRQLPFNEEYIIYEL